MIKNTKYFSILLFSFLLFISCSDEKVNINNYGKTNFYENINRFKNQYFNSEDIGLADNNGYNFPVVFINIDEYLLCTKENKVLYIKGRKFNKEIELNKNEILANKPILFNNNKNILLTFTDGKFKSYDFNFKLLWSGKIELTKFALINEPLVLNSEKKQIIISNTDGLVQSFNFDGKKTWSKQFNSNIYKTIVNDINNNIYVVQGKNNNLQKDTIFVVNQLGEIFKNFPIENGKIIKYPLVSNNRIYFMSSFKIGDEDLSNLNCYDLNFNLIYKKEFNFMLKNLSINSQTNQLFLVTYKSGLSNITNGIFSFDKNGNETWHLYFEYSIPYPLLVSQKEICFTASNQKTIGIFYMDTEKGIVTNVISAGKLPDFNLEPSVNFDGSLMFTCSVSKYLIKIDETPLDKMLPY